MKPQPNSHSLSKLYDRLSPELQRNFVEDHLFKLLDEIPEDKAKRVVARAAKLQARYATAPVLDLSAKKLEFELILRELAKDEKRTLVLKERSNKGLLLHEAVQTLLFWLTDIWRNFYEYHTNYTLAHSCLLFIQEAFGRILEVSTGCNCQYMNLCIMVRITRSSGRLVRMFNFAGAQKCEEILLWMWRDLFISILAHGNEREKALIDGMLADIQLRLGWVMFENLLMGGKQVLPAPGLASLPAPDEDDDDDEYGEDDDEETIYDDDEAADSDGAISVHDEDVDPNWEDASDSGSDSEFSREEFFKTFAEAKASLEAKLNLRDDEEESDDDEGKDIPETLFHCHGPSIRGCIYGRPPLSTHWPLCHLTHYLYLRTLMETRLTTLFEDAPSFTLFDRIISFANDRPKTLTRMLALLKQVEGMSCEGYAVALTVYATERDVENLARILTVEYEHLSRPRDAKALQVAVAMLGSNALCRPRSSDIMIREMLSIVKCLRRFLLEPFSRLETEGNRTELRAIMKLTAQGDARRRALRISAWVDAIATPGLTSPNPLALAAMMMGFPFGHAHPNNPQAPNEPFETADADPTAHVETIDGEDDDLRDLAEEFRPGMRQSFRGWLELGELVPFGQGVFARVYEGVLEMLPIMGAADVVGALSEKLGEHPGKGTLVEGLLTISEFCKLERRNRIAAAKKAAKQKTKPTGFDKRLKDELVARAAAATKAGNSSASGTGAGAGSPRSSSANATNSSNANNNGPPINSTNTPPPLGTFFGSGFSLGGIGELD